MTRRRLVAIALLVALGALLPAARSLAQDQLDPTIIRADPITPDQEVRIVQYIEGPIGKLTSDDPAEIKKARIQLLRPLADHEASVDFRIKYGNRLLSSLRVAAATERELVVVNALIVAGELATDGGIELLDQFRTDQRVAVRYASIAGLARTFDAVAQANSPAILSDGVLSLVARIGQHMAAEADAKILDVCVRALVHASVIDRQGYERIRPAAISELIREATALIQGLGGAGAARAAEVLPVINRAGMGIRDALTAVNPTLQLSTELKAKAGTFGHDMLGYVVSRLKAGDFPAIDPGDPPEKADAKRVLRADAAETVALAEAIIYFAGGSTTPQKNLASMFKEATPARDRAFIDAAR